LQSLLPGITAAGGKVIAITAQPEQYLESTRSLTGYTGDVLVDTENEIATELKSRGNSPQTPSLLGGVFSEAFSPRSRSLKSLSLPGAFQNLPDYIEEVWYLCVTLLVGRQICSLKLRLFSVSG
jgi:hypothetical protein